MQPRTEDRVERWETRPFDGDHDELARLAEGEFSGAVSAGGTWLFLLNGRAVGTVGGDVEDVIGVPGESHEAPHEGLPLLCAMLERGGETRATYYTNDTPLAEVDETLRESSFTGYVELSEQVLSGDYYLVYYGGRRLAVAFIGNAERLKTGEEAFERAADEVGIYEVIDVDLEVRDVPSEPGSVDSEATDPVADVDRTRGDAADEGRGEAGPADPGAGATGGDVGVADLDAGAANAGVEPTDGDENPVDGGASPDPAEPAADERTTGDASTSGADPGSRTGPDDRSVGSEGADPATSESTDRSGITTTEADAESPDVDAGPDAAGAGITAGSGGVDDSEVGPSRPAAGDGSDTATDARRDDANERRSTAPTEPTTTQETEGEGTERFEAEAEWRETRRIPSIDPEASADVETTRESTTRVSAPETDSSATSGSATSGAGSGRDDRGPTRTDVGNGGETGAPNETAPLEEAIEADILEREDKIDRLTQRVDELERQRDQLSEENRALEGEVERLQSRIEALRVDQSGDATALEEEPTTGSADRGGTTGTSAETALSPTRALRETNLFVRYDSKSRPTLESAHDGDASSAEVAENLRLERHTEFDADAAVVDGTPYADYLEGTMAYRFVGWIVSTLLYEIRETGNADAVGDLYDVIPRIDRVEFDATVSLEADETENVPDVVSFDVVAFDKRGSPLLVADLNEGREAATRAHLESLEADASAVKANYTDLGAAFAVTSSFFDPGALEVAEEATKDGFLSRSSKLSYVNLARKQGYHLCLVESRSGGFHVTMPEL